MHTEFASTARCVHQLRDPNLPASARTAAQWFDAGVFALQAPFTFGSAPRNSVIGPGYASLDLAVARTAMRAGTHNISGGGSLIQGFMNFSAILGEIPRDDGVASRAFRGTR